MYIVRINNDEMFDKYLPDYESALSEKEYYEQIVSDVKILEVK